MNFKKVSQTVLSNIFGVTSRTIRNWVDCPRNADNSYDTAKVIEWYVDAARETDGESEVSSSASNWLSMLRKERYLIAELERREKEGQLLERQFIIETTNKQCLAIKHGLEALENRLAPLITGKSEQEVRELIKNECRNMLDRWSTIGEFLPKEEK